MAPKNPRRAHDPSKFHKPGTTKYTPEIADRIIAHLESGATYRSIADQDWAPARATIFDWMVTSPEFGERVKRARQVAAEELHEWAIEDIKRDWTQTELENIRSLSAFVNHRKNCFEADLTRCKVLDPVTYGGAKAEDKKAQTVELRIRRVNDGLEVDTEQVD